MQGNFVPHTGTRMALLLCGHCCPAAVAQDKSIGPLQAPCLAVTQLARPEAPAVALSSASRRSSNAPGPPHPTAHVSPLWTPCPHGPGPASPSVVTLTVPAPTAPHGPGCSSPVLRLAPGTQPGPARGLPCSPQSRPGTALAENEEEDKDIPAAMPGAPQDRGDRSSVQTPASDSHFMNYK